MADMYGPSPKAAGLAAALQQLTGAIPLYHKLRGDEEDRQFRLDEQSLRRQELQRRNELLGLQSEREERLGEAQGIRDAITAATALPRNTRFPTGSPIDALLSRAGLARDAVDTTPAMPFVGSPMSPGPPQPETNTPVPGMRTNVVPRDPVMERNLALQAAKNRNAEIITRLKAEAASMIAEADRKVRESIAAGHDRTAIANSIRAASVGMANVQARLAALAQSDAQFAWDAEFRVALANQRDEAQRDLAAQRDVWLASVAGMLGMGGAQPGAQPGAPAAPAAPATGPSKSNPIQTKPYTPAPPRGTPGAAGAPGAPGAPGATPPASSGDAILDSVLDAVLGGKK